MKGQSTVFLCLLAAASCAKPQRVATLIPLPAQPPVNAVDLEERNDQAEAAAAFYLLKRAPDGTNLPVERYLGAREAARRMPLYSSARRSFVAALGNSHTSHRDIFQQGDTGGWVPLGPGNIGGRTRALVIHPSNPNVIYAGTSGGGVWKTTDGGVTWNPLADLLPSIAVDTIAMDPTAPDTLYAGTGEPTGSVARRGAGIFKTTDGGQTWSQLPGTANPNFYFVNEVLVSPSNSSNVYAATETGVFFSPDGGATWQNSLNRSVPNSGCQDIVMRTDQATDYLFAACGRNNAPQSAIFRNVDAANGAPWVQVLTAPGMGRSSIAIAPSNQATVYALLSSVDPGNPNFINALLGVYRSDSNGDPDSWNALVKNTDSDRTNTSILSYPDQTFRAVCGGTQGNANGQSYLDIIIVVDPTNPDRVWAAGIDIFRSDDGGRNWGIAMFWEAPPGPAAHADNHRLVFHPAYDGAGNQVLYNTSDGGIFVTENANAAVATGDRAGCLPAQTKVNWKTLNNTFAVTEFHYGAPYPSGKWYWGGTQDNGTVRGSDGLGPNSWKAVVGGDGGYVAVNPLDPNVIYHEFTGSSIAKSVNGGQTFTTATHGISDSGFLFIAPFTLDPSNPSRIYTGGSSLWRSDDAAANWSAATAQIAASSGSISAIAVSPADSNTVMFGTSSGRIYGNSGALAADGTTAWNFGRPRSGFVSSLAFDPNNPGTAYAAYSTFKGGSDHYVYKTTDGGATWTGADGAADAGLPDAPVSSLVVDPMNPSTIYAGSDLGTFVSVDGGMTWAREDAPYADVPVVNLALDRGAGASNLFAFTTGRGVWRLSLPGSGAACQYSISSDKFNMPAYGGTSPVNISTGDNCVWVAVPVGTGFGVQSPAMGAGSGTALVTTSVNTALTPRNGTVYFQDQAVSLTQQAALAATRNDEPALSQAIAALPYVGIEDTRRLTSNPSDPVHSCTQGADFKTVWWQVTPAASGTLNIGVQGERYDVFGNSGVVLAVYDGVPAADHELACIQRKRDTTTWEMVNTQVPVTAGKSYLVEVSATGNSANDGGYTILAIALQ